ncbi:MAG: YdiY family protein [Bacteriovoracia bacterium]
MKFFFLLLLAVPTFAAEWKNEGEAGVIISTGNSRAQSLSAKQASDYEWSANSAHVKGSFLQAKNQGQLSARRWDFGIRYERELSRMWRVFLGQSLESDRFAGYQQRYASDLGAKHWLYRVEKEWEWFAELGYRYQMENRTNGSRARDSLVRTYTEASRSWSETASSKLWLEYLPNLSRTRDWLLNGEFSSSFALNAVFAVKLAYLVRYDNEPVNAKNTDTTYTTALVAKF